MSEFKILEIDESNNSRSSIEVIFSNRFSLETLEGWLYWFIYWTHYHIKQLLKPSLIYLYAEYSWCSASKDVPKFIAIIEELSFPSKVMTDQEEFYAGAIFTYETKFKYDGKLQ